MHDIEYIRKNPEGFEKAMKSRGIREFTAKEVLEIDHEKRSLTTKLQDLNRQRNEITEEIKKLKMSKSPCEEQIELSKDIANEIEAQRPGRVMLLKWIPKLRIIHQHPPRTRLRQQRLYR